MNISIKQDSSKPIHRQLQEQIKQLIWSAELQPGKRLPSVRELAGFLRINRNTVARAYEELEREGYVSSQGARGTYVNEQPPAQRYQAELNEFFHSTLQRAGNLGLTPEEYVVQLLAYTQTQLPEAVTAQRALLVECNQPQLQQFKNELERSLPLEVDTALLEELKNTPPDYTGYRLVITTFFHADEVRNLLVGKQVELVTLLLQDNMSALLRLRQLPKGTPTVLICETAHGLINFRKSLQDAGITERLQLRGVLIDDIVEVNEALTGCKVVIASSQDVAGRLTGILPTGVELITDDRSLEARGIELLRQRLQGSNGRYSKKL